MLKLQRGCGKQVPRSLNRIHKIERGSNLTYIQSPHGRYVNIQGIWVRLLRLRLRPRRSRSRSRSRKKHKFMNTKHNYITVAAFLKFLEEKKQIEIIQEIMKKYISRRLQVQWLTPSNDIINSVFYWASHICNNTELGNSEEIPRSTGQLCAYSQNFSIMLIVSQMAPLSQLFRLYSLK